MPTAVAFVPDRPAAQVHESLRRSLTTVDEARRCAVLWFGDVMAATDPAQGELLPPEPTVVAPRELPVRFAVDLTPEQEARRAALVERLHRLGTAPVDRAELLLEALAALLESAEAKGAPRGASIARPPVQIHVHEDSPGGRMTVQIDVGERELAPAEAARLRCDAVVSRSGRRNTTTIAPRVRREVLARDRHRCQAPGCERTRFLEVHHIMPREQGGANDPGNLTTLCSACHRLWHERGGAATLPNPLAPNAASCFDTR